MLQVNHHAGSVVWLGFSYNSSWLASSDIQLLMLLLDMITLSYSYCSIHEVEALHTSPPNTWYQTTLNCPPVWLSSCGMVSPP